MLSSERCVLAGTMEEWSSVHGTVRSPAGRRRFQARHSRPLAGRSSQPGEPEASIAVGPNPLLPWQTVFADGMDRLQTVRFLYRDLHWDAVAGCCRPSD